jgi:hypothetical protein
VYVYAMPVRASFLTFLKSVGVRATG